MRKLIIQKNKYNNKFIINLTLKQLFYFGIHAGHIIKNSCFLAGWMLYGVRSNIFIINLLKSLVLIRLGIRLVFNTIKITRPFWFASLSKNYGPVMSRYATLAGEPFSVYQWIGGNLTNSKLVLGWLSILLYLIKKKKYILRTMDKNTLMILNGFLNKQLRRIKNQSYLNKTKGRWRMRYNRSIYWW